MAGGGGVGGVWPVVVRYPDGPVEEVVEADALDAVREVRTLMVRGPLFGVVAQDAGGGDGRWRVVSGVTSATPQDARDRLNSKLWFRAKDDAEDRAERRALLAAVGRLETEPVDELTVLGTRYRVVRAEEYAGAGEDGIEVPRPTDPVPVDPCWDRSFNEPEVDDGLVLDPAEPVTPTQAAERFAMRDLAYSGDRYPPDVLRDSRRVVADHPEVLLLPTAFRILKEHDGQWGITGGLHASAHGARQTLEFGLTWFEPRQRGLIDIDGDHETDARTLVAAGGHPAADRLASFVRAADRLRAENADEVEADGMVRRVCRMRRLVRWGPGGPEKPRPSDTDMHPPEQIHPRLDEEGVVHYGTG
jgi:hypothetical protein